MISMHTRHKPTQKSFETNEDFDIQFFAAVDSSFFEGFWNCLKISWMVNLLKIVNKAKLRGCSIWETDKYYAW